MKQIEEAASGWIIKGGNIKLEISRKTGCLAALTIQNGRNFEWTCHSGDVQVRDDILERTFGYKHLKSVGGALNNGVLRIEKVFKGAPWRLEETYKVDNGAVAWEAQVILDEGEFRSCAVSYNIPWPQPLYPMQMWAAKDGMPSAPHRFSGLTLEYGEITSGTLMPAFVGYRADKYAGLLVTMPFDFCTPHLTFHCGYRELDFTTKFDWLALSPGKPARTSLLFHGTGGHWRPALGWLYERFKEYFEPRSELINSLWGGHVSGSCQVSLKEVKTMTRLGLRWHEIHAHFPYYGEYHPEGIDQWGPVHTIANFPDVSRISQTTVEQTIRNLHKAGAAALPYIQVSGDGDAKRLPREFDVDRVRDLHGNLINTCNEHYNVYQFNSDPAHAFGRDITRQVKGMVKRYPEMDGVFLDQACYNFLDTAHDDGITAVNNRPCYMTGLNYAPHLELLSKLLHPDKAIIGNGPFGIGIMKYLDGFMAEGSGWLCDLMQYYGLSKPMFFLCYHNTDRDIELMFQRCLIYAAGYSSYMTMMPSKSLYHKYLPLVHRLFRRRWIFDANPITMPTGCKGNVFRGPAGTLLASVVSEMPRLHGRRLNPLEIQVKTADTGAVHKVTLQQLGGKIVEIPFTKDNGAVHFDIPGNVVAAVAELHLKQRSL